MSLAKYRRKRSFRTTPEPRGKEHSTKSGALHFVVQKHDASHLHYDFRLELDGVLKSWAVPKGPSMNPKDKRLAMMVEDHPISYMRFEGAIPEGNYGAGDVIVWDIGMYTSSETADPEESRKKLKAGLHKGELKFVLFGEKLKGGFALVKMKGRGENAWLLVKEKDEFATKEDVLARVASPLSGKALPRDSEASPKRAKSAVEKSGTKRTKRAKRDRMPHSIAPMLATLVEEPFDKKGWYFEVKWDGYRAIAEIEGKKKRLYSRNGIDFSEKYPQIFEALDAIDHECVLDGEIVALKSGKPDFHTLQQYALQDAPLQYVVFDLLYLDGEDLRGRPLSERKAKLRDILPRHPQLLLSEHVEENGKAFFKKVRERDIEGMLAKDAKSPYHEGVRGDEWLKVKSMHEQEAIIVGYTEPRGSRKNLGALVLAAYEGKKLVYIGHSGGGFTEKKLADICKKLAKYKVSKSPLDEKVPINSPITWVKPHYVCQIKFTEWTASGRMRHPIYAGLRVDKKPEDVVKELPSATATKKPMKKQARKKAELSLTNLDKIFWKKEGFTKGDVIEYYDRIAETILPYLKDRPQNLYRTPSGASGKGFFQKDTSDLNLPDFVETVKVHSDSRERDDQYIVCNNKETLLYLANLGCIELNPWTSRVQRLKNPDFMIIDLDPGENTWDELIEVAQHVHKVLSLACEEHYPKTSGKTGMHICVPLNAVYTYDEIKNFAQLIATLVHQRVPDLTSVERAPGKRKKKIYIDFLQNRYGQTIAAPYAIRPYPGATVSTPLEWKEVKKGLDPQDFTIETIAKRLKKKGDLWKPVLGKGVDLKDSIRCLQEELERS